MRKWNIRNKWMFEIFFFQFSKSKKDKKQIFLFTINDEPHSKFSAKQKQAERRIGDLQDEGVSIFLFPIGEAFNTAKVYQVRYPFSFIQALLLP